MIGPSFGANGDALEFHRTAIAYSHNISSYEFKVGDVYSLILAIVYAHTAPSIFIGCLLSVLAWFLSALLLLMAMRALMAGAAAQDKVMLIYALLPTSILYTSVTLREALQLLFVNLFLFSSLQIILRKLAGYWLPLMMAAVGMGVLHGALIAFGVYGLILVLIGSILTRELSFPAEKALLIAVVVICVGISGSWAFYNFSYGRGIGLGGGLASQVEFYHHFAYKGARSQYINGETHIRGTLDLMRFLPYSYWQYLFSPMPWRISSALDVELLGENVLRAWLFWRILSRLRIPTLTPRIFTLGIFASYLLLEGFWSLGTLNWGTAARHHLPSLGLLLAAAYAYDPQPGWEQRGGWVSTATPALT